MTTITIPDLALVCLIGVSGSGKSTFAARHFLPSEVLSSDACRRLVADDENDQSATEDAFDVLHHIAGVRLRAGRLTVVDATSVQRDARASLVALARAHHVLPVAVVLDVPEAVCAARNAQRPDRDLPHRALRRQSSMLRRSLRHLQKEGFRRVFVLDGVEAVEAATVVRERRWTDRRDEHGPFDVVGDATAAPTSWSRCWAGSATRSRRIAPPPPIPTAAAPCSWATSSTVAPTAPASSAW